MQALSRLRRISSDQIIEARMLLCWTSNELAKRARITHNSMIRLENQKSLPNARLGTISAVISTLEASGIVFKENEVSLNLDNF
jgi:DNA-binding XRE family transcriptional regulator